jgi:hypothetical protein
MDEYLPIEPGKPEWRDYEYERGGVVVNLFLFCEPLRGSRWVGGLVVGCSGAVVLK